MRVTRLGLESAVPKDGKKGGRRALRAEDGRRDPLAAARHAGAQTRYLLTAEKNESPSDALDGLGGFYAAHLDEARAVAAELRFVFLGQPEIVRAALHQRFC
ncbi:hypothetical protein WMF45_06305 [Sorangium sp. So ce448]|uniref:hypothetical protein n=1 Tax=Sorangium sp. So ce448 TaxID=3133314 RepID=UPI003F5FAF59